MRRLVLLTAVMAAACTNELKFPSTDGGASAADSGIVNTDADPVDAVPLQMDAGNDDATSPDADVDAMTVIDAGDEPDADQSDGPDFADADLNERGFVPDGQANPDATGGDSGPIDGGTLAITSTVSSVAMGALATFTVNAPANSSVIWTVDGQMGGSAMTGTIASQLDPLTAIYTAPRNPIRIPPSQYTISAAANGETATTQINLEFPQPQITSVLPQQLAAGSPNTSITIRGRGFLPQSTTTFAGAALTALSQDWNVITVEIPDTMLQLPGTAVVSVRNPFPGGGTESFSVEIIVLEEVVPIDVNPAAPALFAAATVSTNAGRKPVITYPEHETIAPRDFPEPTVSWTQAADINTCRVSITGQGIDVQLFVNSDPASFGQWENIYTLIESRIWQLMMFQFRSIELIIEVACGEIIVAGGQATLSNNLIEVSDPISYQISTEGASGRIVYFSGYENGLVRIDISGSFFQSVNWLGPTALFDTQTPDCVGCHSFTRTGDLLAYSTFTAEFGTYSVNNGQLSTELTQGRPQTAEWSALHPDGQYLAAIDNNHQLNLHDAVTGNLIMNVPTSTIAPLITQPFWSPLGDKIVFVASSTAGAEGILSVEEGSIWTLDFSTSTGSPVFSNGIEIVGPQATGGNAYYPSISPDGEWIAFCRAPSGESYNNSDGQLWMIKTDLSIGPVSLDRANFGTSLYNSWPRWAPSVNQGQYWIVFSSHRAYGPYDDGGPQQLWVTRIDTNLSGDPSNPALWLEGQNPFAGNLTAEWSINQ